MCACRGISPLNKGLKTSAFVCSCIWDWILECLRRPTAVSSAEWYLLHLNKSQMQVSRKLNHMYAPCVAKSSCICPEESTTQPWNYSSLSRGITKHSFMCGMFVAFFLTPFGCPVVCLKTSGDLKPYGVSQSTFPFITQTEEVIRVMSTALPIVVVTVASSLLYFISFVCTKTDTYNGIAQNSLRTKENG